MLGYRPVFKEYTTDWDFAVAKMKGSYFNATLFIGLTQPGNQP